MNETKILTATLNRELKAIKDSLDKLSQRKGIDPLVLQEFITLIGKEIVKPKGEKGDRGDTGKSIRGKQGKSGRTPRRGIDFWTDADIAYIVSESIKVTKPKKGQDYFTEDEIKSVVSAVRALITIPKFREDYYTDAEKSLFKDELKAELQILLDQIEDKQKEILKANSNSFIVGDGVAKITVSTIPPEKPKEGDLWVKTT